MKIRLSLIFITLSFFFLSCSNGISQKGEGYVTVDLNEFVQRISSRSAVSGQPVDVTLWTEGDYLTSVTQTVTDNGSEPIILDNIPVNSSISINIEAAIGRKNYLGASEKIVVQNGNNPVSIRLKKTLPTTDIVLYNQTAEGYSYYLANSTGTNLNSPAQFFGPAYNLADFCFDSNGNVYLGTNNDMTYFYYYDVSKKQVYQIQTEQISYSGFLDYDFAKNQLWFIANDNKFYKFSQLNENSPDSYSANFTVYNFRTDDLGIDDTPLASCVYNDIVYLAYSTVDNDDVPFVLLEYDISSAEVDVEVPTQFYIEAPKATKELCKDMDLSTEAKITDMIYQDGAVFILLREFGSGNNLSMSRGAIIKYDENSGSVTSNGFAPETTLTSFKAVCTDGTNPLYKDNGHNEYFTSNFEAESGASYKLRANWNGLSDAFVGPEKFIAIKPKKLVISDTGYAFYTNSDGLLAKKHINRVVEVDLKDLSIGTTTVVDCKFNTEDLDTAFASGFRTNTTGKSCYKRSGSAYENLAFPMFLEEE